MDVNLINISTDPDVLNENCGAEFVHKEQALPTGIDKETHVGMKLLSFDGDADRQIYYHITEEGEIKILDGDKQFAFILKYIGGLLNELGIEDLLPTIFVHSPYTNLKTEKYLAE